MRIYRMLTRNIALQLGLSPKYQLSPFCQCRSHKHKERPSDCKTVKSRETLSLC